MKLTLALVTACALWSVPAFAQSPTAQHSTAAAMKGSTISTPEFIKQVILGNMFDEQAARLADQRGDLTERSFAPEVVLGRAEATEALKTMVDTGTVNAKIPTALAGEYQQKMAELQNLWGQSFDTAYRRELLQNDQNQISLFERYAATGDNANLKQWAMKMLPGLKSHLVYAQLLTGEGQPGPAREEWQYDGTY
jgi:putative membrane protein